MIISYYDILDTINKINNDIIAVKAQIAITSLVLTDTEKRVLETDERAYTCDYANEHLNAVADKAYNEHLIVCNEYNALEREQNALERIYDCLIELQNAVLQQDNF